jgi:hypothetical protein
MTPFTAIYHPADSMLLFDEKHGSRFVGLQPAVVFPTFLYLDTEAVPKEVPGWTSIFRRLKDSFGFPLPELTFKSDLTPKM